MAMNAADVETGIMEEYSLMWLLDFFSRSQSLGRIVEASRDGG